MDCYSRVELTAGNMIISSVISFDSKQISLAYNSYQITVFYDFVLYNLVITLQTKFLNCFLYFAINNYHISLIFEKYQDNTIL